MFAQTSPSRSARLTAAPTPPSPNHVIYFTETNRRFTVLTAEVSVPGEGVRTEASLATLLLLACIAAPASPPPSVAPPPDAPPANTPPDPISALLSRDLTDGFDLPFGDGDGGGAYTAPDGRTYDGWYVATRTGQTYALGVHTGEDWNGKGGGDTDLGQPVYAAAKGAVVASADFGRPWGNIVVVEHRYVENAQLRAVRTVYAHLDRRDVAEGDVVARRQPIGTIGTGNGAYAAHLHFEVRPERLFDEPPDFWPTDAGYDAAWVNSHYEAPAAFITAHRRLMVPATAPSLLVAEKDRYRMSLFRSGQRVMELRIALSQDPVGPKQQQGDNRTPEGQYVILEKSWGPFTGKYAAYFGPAWMRISYPNAFDAAAALADGRISATDAQRITTATAAGTEPPKDTPLGGGIGVHGWAGPWPGADRQNLTWGCISVQNPDLERLVEATPVGTVVMILP